MDGIYVPIILVWFIGAVITYGYIGGIRDEMDGIGDMAAIIFWPLCLVWILFCAVIIELNGIGRALKEEFSIFKKRR